MYKCNNKMSNTMVLVMDCCTSESKIIHVLVHVIVERATT